MYTVCFDRRTTQKTRAKPFIDQLLLSIIILNQLLLTTSLCMCVLTFEATLVDLCGEGWIATGFGTCVKLIREQKDFHDAKNICVSHDSQLVTLHTRERFNFLKGLFKKESKKYILLSYCITF